jgi:hypothetical protein
MDKLQFGVIVIFKYSKLLVIWYSNIWNYHQIDNYFYALIQKQICHVHYVPHVAIFPAITCRATCCNFLCRYNYSTGNMNL